LASMRACALRWRLRIQQVKEGKDWAWSEAREMLESAMWYRKYVNTFRT